MGFEQPEKAPDIKNSTSTAEEAKEACREERDLLAIVVEGRANLERVDSLMRNYPDFFRNNTTLTRDLAGLRETLNWADSHMGTCNPAERDRFQRSYNEYADRVNESLLALVKEENSEALEADLKKGTEEFVRSLSAAEQEEISSFALEHWDELFPPTFSERMYKELRNTTTFDDYSLAYASGVINGAEVTAKGFLSLFDPQTYRDLRDAIDTLPEISMDDMEKMGVVLKKVIATSDWPDRIFFLTTMVVSTLMVGGIIGRLERGAMALELPATLKTLTSTARFSRSACALQLLALFKMGMSAENLGEAGQAIPAYSMSSVPFRRI